MKIVLLRLLPVLVTLCCSGYAGSGAEQGEGNIVRLAIITVEPEMLEDYNRLLKEEIEASMRLEEGVLALYAVAEKENPHIITILEIYADEDSYLAHLETEHFKKYKQGTLDMVRHLELRDVDPLVPGLKIN